MNYSGFFTPDMLDILRPEELDADALAREIEHCEGDESALIESLAEHLTAPTAALGQALLDGDVLAVGRLSLQAAQYGIADIAKSRLDDRQRQDRIDAQTAADEFRDECRGIDPYSPLSIAEQSE